MNLYSVMFWPPCIAVKNNCFLYQLFYKLSTILQIVYYLKILFLCFLNLLWSCPKTSGKWLSNWRSLCWVTTFILPCLPGHRKEVHESTVHVLQTTIYWSTHRYMMWVWKITLTEKFMQLPFHKLLVKTQI